MEEPRRTDAGMQAEDQALSYLQRQGLSLVMRNYRCRAGEIDLVMLHDETLALIEVRYRASGSYGGAAASVTYRKQRRIIQAARHLWMTQPRLHRYPARYDVVAISQGGLRVEWIRGAFV